MLPGPAMDASRRGLLCWLIVQSTVALALFGLVVARAVNAFK
jgi:hypothetical protein